VNHHLNKRLVPLTSLTCGFRLSLRCLNLLYQFFFIVIVDFFSYVWSSIFFWKLSYILLWFILSPNKIQIQLISLHIWINILNKINNQIKIKKSIMTKKREWMEYIRSIHHDITGNGTVKYTGTTTRWAVVLVRHLLCWVQ
jgi:hypothetical protein